VSRTYATWISKSGASRVQVDSETYNLETGQDCDGRREWEGLISGTPVASTPGQVRCTFEDYNADVGMHRYMDLSSFDHET
jgi:hypothetical protein